MPPPLADWLDRKGAHHDVLTWARDFGTDWARAWETCPRGDWLLGIAARGGVDPKPLVRAAAACARLALAYLPPHEDRPVKAIETAEAWTRDEVSDAAVAHAADLAAAAAEEAPDPATASAATAAAAAAHAAKDPDSAATAAAAAVQAAVLDTGECALLSALTFAHAKCAERVREAIPFAAVAPDP